MSKKLYRFLIENGYVKKVYEIENGYVELEKIDVNESWSVAGSSVVKTEYEDGMTKTTRFADIDGDGYFNKVSNSYQNSNYSISSYTSGTSEHNNGYKFKVADGLVVQILKLDNGRTSVERIESDEKWSIFGSNFLKIENDHGVIEKSVYSDPDGDGIYIRASKTYTSSNGMINKKINDNEHGGDNEDYWYGTSSSDYFFASSGNDLLKGGHGNDYLLGGDGDDRLFGENHSDRLIGGHGSDFLDSGSGNDKLYGSEGKDVLRSGIGNDFLQGGSHKDILDGGLGVDTADYSDKTTTVRVMLNKSTNTYVYVNNLIEDTIKNIENVTGGSGADVLVGDSFANTLKGNSGGDTLIGGLGKDTLYGGTGVDKFVFGTSLSTNNTDNIEDFANGLDKLILDDDIFTKFTGTSVDESNFIVGSNPLDSDDFLIYDTSKDMLYYDADGSGSAYSMMEITQIELAGSLSPTYTDFIVIS